MKLSIENLQEVGAFVGAPVEKEISWKHQGKEYTATVFVKELSYHEAAADLKGISGKQDGIAKRIASCIVDEDGISVFTVEDITGEADPSRGPLCEPLTMALLSVIGEVTYRGKSTS